LKKIIESRCCNVNCHEYKDVLFQNYCYSCFLKYRKKWDVNTVKMWFLEDLQDGEMRIHADTIPQDDDTLIIIDEFEEKFKNIAIVDET